MMPACNDSTVQAGIRAFFARAVLMSGLPLGMLVLAGGSAQARPPCPPPTTSFAVTAEHYPPAIKSSYTSRELRSLASQTADKGPHPPFGFYIGTFGYGVEVMPHEAQGCPVSVMVRLFLAPRLIEIATDGPCRPEIVAEHYMLHAREDDLLLSRYAVQAQDMLDHIEQTSPFGSLDEGRRDAVVRSISAALDRLLEPYDGERSRALRAADTDEALARLAQGCGHAT